MDRKDANVRVGLGSTREIHGLQIFTLEIGKDSVKEKTESGLVVR